MIILYAMLYMEVWRFTWNRMPIELTIRSNLHMYYTNIVEIGAHILMVEYTIHKCMLGLDC